MSGGSSPAAHSAIAVGESCPAAVNAHTARASTNSSGCHRPARLRGSGTSSRHPRRHRREGPTARAADKPPRGTSIREDRTAGTVLSRGQDGWYLRSSGTVPACQTGHPAPEPATTHSRALTRHPAHPGTEIKLAGAVAGAELQASFRRAFTCASGDWDSGNLAFAVSRGSPQWRDLRARGHRFPGMLFSLASFQIKVSHKDPEISPLISARCAGNSSVRLMAHTA